MRRVQLTEQGRGPKNRTSLLSRVWVNGVLDLGDGFRVLNPIGFFTEAVRCDNCEARCAHGARARTQEPNLPRAADNLHV